MIMATFSTSKLTIDDLVTVQSEVWTARHRWYNIGLQLGLKPDVLDCIQMSPRITDLDSCFTEMLKAWLRQGNTDKTWGKLIEALRSETVNFSALADTITNKIDCINWRHNRTSKHHSATEHPERPSTEERQQQIMSFLRNILSSTQLTSPASVTMPTSVRMPTTGPSVGVTPSQLSSTVYGGGGIPVVAPRNDIRQPASNTGVCDIKFISCLCG